VEQKQVRTRVRGEGRKAVDIFPTGRKIPGLELLDLSTEGR